ncbi:unnamed protein product [Rotaria magnacalcarata]|uniref:Uncharacterized protein n=2 Tax=Rotaria magnacalcarata TaxID=392030 RepID=A0A816XUD4_9BILA|nr:unnamed protein product [Rotaria magnacalcarata]CAF2150943.1 unnamed protein product [Rotaria magnacalcarata]
MMAWHRLHWCLRMLKSKTGRMVIMLILTVSIAVTEIICGISIRSQLLIADGLFSFAEGIALVGSLIALRYAKAERLHSKNTFGWARLEILAGLLQEVLLVSLSLSIIVDAVNKLINPNHIKDPFIMISLGSVGVFIGLLGLVLFRGFDHDHNIGHEIVEQKKNDFVRSVYTTLRSLDTSNETTQDPLMQQTSVSSSQPIVIPKLIVTESSSNIYNNNNNNNNSIEQKIQQKPNLILPSLNDAYQNAFIASDVASSSTEEHITDAGEKQLRVPGCVSVEFKRMRSRSGDSIISSTSFLDHDDLVLEDEFQKSRVFATLHALCLHSLAVLLESSIVLLSGLLIKFIPQEDKDGEKINLWLKYIDPSLTLVMVVIIGIKAIPVIWSLGHILVEAVPSGIDTRQLIQTIMKTIPQIRAVHGVHVWRATARDVFATLHVVCDEDLVLSACTDLLGRQLQRILATHCIRHFTVQFEYSETGGNINKCAYGTRRRSRGHQSTSEDNDNVTTQSQID